jgi:hypothetical protein
MTYWWHEVYEDHKDKVLVLSPNEEFFNWFYDQRANIIDHWIAQGGDTNDKDGIIEFAKQVYDDFIS